MVACSSEAEARGVRIGMPLAEAAALARHRGNFVAVAHDRAADLQELARLAEKCERFSPLVGWETVDCEARSVKREILAETALGPAHLFLDVTGIGRLFGGEENLLAQMRQEFAAAGYEIQVAIAGTIGAAWAGAEEVQGSRFEVQGLLPSLCTLHSALYTLHSTLSPLPVSALRLPAETLDLLAQLGITRIEELLKLPRESLTARFGERLLLRIDQALGTAQEMIVPYRSPPRFQAEWILEYPTDSRELVEQVLSQLLQRVATALAQRQEGVMQLACRLDGAGGRPLQLTVGLFRPSAAAEHLEELLRMQLEQTRLPRQIGRIGMAAILTAPLENRQGELFAGSAREVSRDFALLVDRLSSRLGPTAVLQPVLRADPLPERAVCYRAVVGKKRKKRGQGSRFKVQSSKSPASNPKSEISLRPLFLHHPPLALAAVSVVPDGPPISFELGGRTHRIVRHWGPERIETGWWRGRSLRRDYYRIETTTGLCYWLFRRLDDGRWHLHGEYG